MRRTAVVVMTVATVFPGQAEQAAGNDRTVVVHIANEHVAMEALAFAKPQATQMFAKIGIRLQWRGTGHAPLPQNAIAVEMVEQAFTDECVGALACSKPYEGTHIRVFYDRLQTKVRKNIVPPLLGYVLVHEITHILQGSSRHTDRGVMKAQWDANDFERMRSGSLSFTDSDVVLIERGLAARKSGNFPRALPPQVPN